MAAAPQASSHPPNHLNETPTLPIRTNRVGAPRLDPYSRLLNRLYEPLFLLNALGQTRGKHTAEPKGRNELDTRRRNFFQTLAYLCDFKKGGASCTAIAVEDTKHQYIFWVASNDETCQEKVASFLRNVLESLSQIDNRGDRRGGVFEEEKDLISTCVEFAAQRVTKDSGILKNAIRACQGRLKERGLDADRKVSVWLDSAMSHSSDKFNQCRTAWEAAKSGYMNILSAEAQREERQRGANDNSPGPFATTRHFIGRLAFRFYAPRLLLRQTSSVSFLLSDFDVRLVSSFAAVPPPLQDTHTTLDGILNRMLRRDDPERKVIEEALIDMNRTAGIFRDFMQKFFQCQPVVHAEIKILEHFFRGRQKFVDNDKFVACSKPACLCCKLYFQHHPARMVIPPSHEKVWANWSPPQVPVFSKGDEESDRQRDVLNKIIEALRTDAIAQVLKCSQPPGWHADSQTGVTALSESVYTSSEYRSSETESTLLSSPSSDHPSLGNNVRQPPSRCVGNESRGEDGKCDDSDEGTDDDHEGGVPI